MLSDKIHQYIINANLPEWWNKLSKEAQQEYLKSHPKSKIAHQFKQNKPEKQHELLVKYQEYAGDLNSMLRGEKDPVSNTAKSRKFAHELTNYLSQQSLPENMVVFRGFSGHNFLKKIKHSIYFDPAFMSTTLEEDAARKFTGEGQYNENPDPNEWIMRIELPKGSPAAHIKGQFNKGEILVQRGQKYHVTGWYPGKKLLSVRLIPGEPPALKKWQVAGI